MTILRLNSRPFERRLLSQSRSFISQMLQGQPTVSHKLRQNILREYCSAIELIRKSQIFSSISPNFSSPHASLFKATEKMSQEQAKRPQSNNEEESNEGNEKKEPSPREIIMKAAIIAFFSMPFLLGFFRQGDNLSGGISWNEFYHLMLSKGEVKRVIINTNMKTVFVILHEGAVIKGHPISKEHFMMRVSDIEKFEQRLREAEKNLGIKPENGVQVVYQHYSMSIFYSLLLAIAVIWLMFKFNTKMMKNMFSIDFKSFSRAKFTIVDSLTGSGKGVKFKDVAGLHEAKIEIMEFVDYLKSPEKYTALGAKVPKGVLLLGPPGCGKTMLAKAVATEANVPFLAMAGSEFIDMIGGVGAARVRDLFKEAKKRAPCIVYIDEIDAIGRRRASEQVSSGEEEQTLNQLLVEMDGIYGREGVIMLASTNRAKVLDKALLRPGRFDRHILIDLPNLAERKETFEKYLRDIKLAIKVEDVIGRMASLTPGFSGADIANVCNEAALHAARCKRQAVSAQDLEYAVERVVGGTEKRSSVISPQERRIVAFHESGHALVGWLLKHTDALLKVTIVPRTSNVLGFAMYTPTDQRLYNQQELFERMCMALGGRVAESIVFNSITSGAMNDLQKVTKMAYSQVKNYGMDDVVGPMSFPMDEEQEAGSFGKKPYSKKLGNSIDLQARLLVAKAYRKTEEVLKENVDKLSVLAEALLEKEVLNYSDVEKLIGPPPFGHKKCIEALDLGPIDGESSTNDVNGAISGDKGKVD